MYHPDRGGYASRAGMCLNGLESEVEAVIHGAMPTHGSPATYYQFRSGAVGGQIEKQILGKNAADTTAILGFCQGGLELLPNKLYANADNQAEWLYLNKEADKQSDKRQLLEIGYGNQIFNFYRQFDKWYSLVQPVLLAPELNNPTDDQLKEHKKAFKDRIKACETFHDKLAAKFHKTTLLLYSNNPATKAFDVCEWQLQNSLTPGLKSTAAEQWHMFTNENHDSFSSGEVNLISRNEFAEHQAQLSSWLKQQRYNQYAHLPPVPANARFALAAATANGDGTVHEGAGKYPTGVQTMGLNATQTHQGFYNCPYVRELVTAMLQTWLPDIHNQFKPNKKG